MITLSTIILGFMLLMLWAARKIREESRWRLRFSFGPMIRPGKRSPSLFYPAVDTPPKATTALWRDAA